MAQQQSYWGNEAGPRPSFYNVNAAAEITEYGESSAHVRHHYILFVGENSDFYGTQVDTSWAGRLSLTTYGWYADSGWIDDGWISYGSYATLSCSCQYTDGRHRSSLTEYYYPQAPTWAPNAQTNVTNTRNSDSSNTITWTRNVSTARPYSTQYVYQEVNDGGFSRIATLSGSATSYTASTSIDNYYRYKLYVENGAGESSWSNTTATTYNTPKVPPVPTLARATATNVNVTISGNTSHTATKVELQRSANKSATVGVQTLNAVNGVVVDAAGGGTWYYRARNTRDSLASPWSAWSAAITTMQPPAKPTLVSPQSGELIEASDKVRFAWRHNSLDGSIQSAAEVRYAIGSGAWVTKTVTTAAQLQLTELLPNNSTVKWQVRTKGSDANFGAWSDTGTFYIKQHPVGAITKPAVSETIKDMPISVELSYTDASGSLAEAVVYIKSGNKTLFTKSMGTSLKTTISAKEFLPNNKSTYAIEAFVRSTSSLSYRFGQAFSTDFVEPETATANIKFDEETGSAAISVSVTPDSTRAKCKHISVYRVTGKKTLIHDGGLSYSFDDRFCPINKEFTYEVVSFSETGTFHTQSYEVKFESESSYLVTADNYMRCEWNPSLSVSLKQPNRKLVYHAGAKKPTKYNSKARERTYKMGAIIVERKYWDSVVAIWEEGSTCIVKNSMGDVFWADIDVDFDFEQNAPITGEISLSATEITGADV